MSELRWDPLRHNWVIIAEERGRRPRDFHCERQKITMVACPFCYGHEDKTPPEVFAIRPPHTAANSSGWQVRVIPNKYPALKIEGELDKRAHGMYDAMAGIGAHEVIVETPDHERDLADLSAEEITLVLRAYRNRLQELRKDSRFRYIAIFKNHGPEAGATVAHAHSQLIAVPVIPPVITTELAASRDHYERKERCLLCDLLSQEREDGKRIVSDSGDFVVFTPYASCFPFELKIAPGRHSHDFALLDDSLLEKLAHVFKDTLVRLRTTLRDPPFNLVLHTAPPRHDRIGHPDYWQSLPHDYHWYFELIPRLTKIAGFEWGTGFYLNPTPPETAAGFLREVEVVEQ